MRESIKETAETYVLASIGLIRGIGSVVIKPFLMEQVDKVRHIQPASITFYNTSESEVKDE